MASIDKGYAEASYVGFGFGALLGAMTVGSAVDLLTLPVNSMLAYFVGGILGGLAGFVAGRVAATKLL
jgi:hypothetical protein